MIAKKWVGVMDANAGSIHDFGPHPSCIVPSLKLEVSLRAPMQKLSIEKMRNAI
jgi:hypothetical protein